MYIKVKLNIWHQEWNIDYEELPFDALNKNVDTGYTNVSISKDGFVRSTQVYINNEGDIKYGFPGQIYNVYKRRHGENITIDEIVKNNCSLKEAIDCLNKNNLNLSKKDIYNAGLNLKEMISKIIR